MQQLFSMQHNAALITRELLALLSVIVAIATRLRSIP
jgi:hypothetical protein